MEGKWVGGEDVLRRNKHRYETQHKHVLAVGRVVRRGNWIGSIETATDEWIVAGSPTRDGVFKALGEAVK